jgi:hypothetical protein
MVIFRMPFDHVDNLGFKIVVKFAYYTHGCNNNDGDAGHLIAVFLSSEIISW